MKAYLRPLNAKKITGRGCAIVVCPESRCQQPDVSVECAVKLMRCVILGKPSYQDWSINETFPKPEVSGPLVSANNQRLRRAVLRHPCPGQPRNTHAILAPQQPRKRLFHRRRGNSLALASARRNNSNLKRCRVRTNARLFYHFRGISVRPRQQ